MTRITFQVRGDTTEAKSSSRKLSSVRQPHALGHAEAVSGVRRRNKKQRCGAKRRGAAEW